MQAVGLVNNVLPHAAVARHAFSHPKGRCFADIQPMTDEFGWSRRNTPSFSHQVDAVIYHVCSVSPGPLPLLPRSGSL